MTIETLKLKLTGVRPLLMHNGRLANPTEDVTKALKVATGKKPKTEALAEECKKLEWLGGLYQDEKGRPCVTEDMVLGCLVEGAKKSKLGKQATAGVLGGAPFFTLEHKGPSDVLALYDTGKFCDYRSAVVARRRIMRARPRFDQWSVTVTLMVETTTINVDQVIFAMKTAGATSGIGDHRPRFGRFDVERVE